MFGKTALQVLGIFAVLATIGGFSLAAPAIATDSSASNSLTITDNDTVEQTNVQSSSQNAEIDSNNDLNSDASNTASSSTDESGDGDNLAISGGDQSNTQTEAVVNAQVQGSEQTASNSNYDNDEIEAEQISGAVATEDDSDATATNDASISDNDSVEQGNLQISEQNADIDSDNNLDADASNDADVSADEEGDGDNLAIVGGSQSNDQTNAVVNAQVQGSSQSASNYNEDDDSVEAEQLALAGAFGDDSDAVSSNAASIEDDDDVLQQNLQGSSQSAKIRSDNNLEADASNTADVSADESGDGDNLAIVGGSQSNTQTEAVVNAQVQGSEQTASNSNYDDDFFGVFQLAGSLATGDDSDATATNDASISDNDEVGQINLQEQSQYAKIRSDNSIDADASNDLNATADEEGDGDNLAIVGGSQSNTQTEAVINAQVQLSSQDASNYNEDDDTMIAGQIALAGAFGDDSDANATNNASIDDSDLVLQGNGQESNQTAHIYSDNDLGSGNNADNVADLSADESGDGDNLAILDIDQSNDQTKAVVNAQVQASEQSATNSNYDDDFFGVFQLAGAVATEDDSDATASNDASIADGDLVDQINLQEQAQDLDLDSDNTFEADSTNVADSSADEEGDGDNLAILGGSQSNTQTEAVVNAQIQAQSQSSSNFNEDNDSVEGEQCSIASDNLLAALILGSFCFDEEPELEE